MYFEGFIIDPSRRLTLVLKIHIPKVIFTEAF